MLYENICREEEILKKYNLKIKPAIVSV